MELEKEMWKEVGAARRVARGTRWKMKRDGTNGAARKERKREHGEFSGLSGGSRLRESVATHWYVMPSASQSDARHRDAMTSLVRVFPPIVSPQR